MNWRVQGVQEPNNQYKTLAVYDHSSDTLLASVTWVVYTKHGGKIGYLLDLLHRDDQGRYADQLLGCAIHEMTLQGADLCLAWCFAHSPNHPSLLKNVFLPMPERLRPIELHVGVRALASPSSRYADPHAWYISYCDSDTV